MRRCWQVRWLLLAWCWGIPILSDAQSLELLEGRRLANTYCVTCHLFPEPDAVDLKTWHDQILPRMKYRLGFSSAELDQSPNIKLLREHRRIPSTPVITEEQWLKLSAYYFTNAPLAPLPQEPRSPITVGLPGFKAFIAPYRAPNPSVTAIRVLPGSGTVIVADDTRQDLSVLDGPGRLKNQLSVSNTVTSLRWNGRELLASAIGSFQPSDELRGAVLQLSLPAPFELQPANSLLKNLPRTTDALEADLNGDGRLDLVVSSFGNNLGGLSWYEALPDGSFRPHELFNLPGVLRAETGDFDRDGHLDVVALVAQETEALFLFAGDGQGGFTRKTIFQRPPYWGHSSFEVVDFDGDHRPDFLVTSGDNGEFSSPAKRCHGVRLYSGQQDGTWKETFFFPMNGAYKALARDFDGDGDLDIAAISFFPDYQKSPRESFVFLRNDGANRFTPFTFAECATGRWLCLDAGDLDGDGDDDLVLGSYIHGPTSVPPKLMSVWEQANLPVMMLLNQAKQPAATPGQ